jgi:hypothetical protein
MKFTSQAQARMVRTILGVERNPRAARQLADMEEDPSEAEAAAQMAAAAASTEKV